MDAAVNKEKASVVNEGELLSVDEFLAGINGLSNDDHIKLAGIEKWFLGGTGFQRGELLHEAICRTLLGQRHCPKDVPVMAFLIETMRSVSGHSRDRQKKTCFIGRQKVMR